MTRAGSIDHAQSCYHCGLPVPAGSRFVAVIDDAQRSMCCAGCQAVAEAIAGHGFTSYYRSRSAYAARRQAEPLDDDLGLYDLPEVQRDFVREIDGAREATLMLEGITCAACIWLNERHLAGLPGVQSVEINYTTHRARVRWNPAAVRLSDILRAVTAVGYRAFPATSSSAERARRRETRTALWRLFVAGFGMMQVMMYAVPTYLADDGTMTPDILALMHLASLVLTVPVLVYSAAPFFLGAWRDFTLRRPGMDAPVALGIGAAFAASTYSTFAGVGEVYFDSIAMFVFFLLCARYLEMRARQKAAASLEYLDRALPLAAHRLRDYPASRDTHEVPAVSLKPGDCVLVKPGEAVPADGVLVDGETETDEALLSGESRPVVKRIGMQVVAGAVNRLSPAILRVEQVGEATRASHIRRLTERAAAQRPHLVEITDRIAGWFVAGVLAAAAATALYWASFDPSRALWVTVAVLVVTCPCALSLATPTALAVSIGTLARRGVVATRGHAIEALARVTHVVFDKTGTLTQGRLTLAALEPLGGVTRVQALALAAGLEQGSEHPIASTIHAAAAAEEVNASMPKAARHVAGSGVEGRIDGVLHRIGNAEFVAGLTGTPVPPRNFAAATRVWLGSERGWLAVLTFADSLRADAAQVVADLQAAGKRIMILSGDEPTVVQAIAERLGVPDAEGGLSPEAKHARVRALQEQGAMVAMVGDGVNDAPVLAQAQLSIAMGSGAVLSQAQSDLVLLEGRLVRLLEAFGVARRTMRIIRQNLAWAVAYNLVALPFAIAGYVTPWLAGIGMGASSLIVVLNALRLMKDEGRRTKDGGPRTRDSGLGAQDSDLGTESPVPRTEVPSPQP
jgi:Cu2+-exporting ATPase